MGWGFQKMKVAQNVLKHILIFEGSKSNKIFKTPHNTPPPPPAQTSIRRLGGGGGAGLLVVTKIGLITMDILWKFNKLEDTLALRQKVLHEKWHQRTVDKSIIVCDHRRSSVTNEEQHHKKMYVSQKWILNGIFHENLLIHRTIYLKELLNVMVTSILKWCMPLPEFYFTSAEHHPQRFWFYCCIKMLKNSQMFTTGLEKMSCPSYKWCQMSIWWSVNATVS